MLWAECNLQGRSPEPIASGQIGANVAECVVPPTRPTRLPLLLLLLLLLLRFLLLLFSPVFIGPSPSSFLSPLHGARARALGRCRPFRCCCCCCCCCCPLSTTVSSGALASPAPASLPPFSSAFSLFLSPFACPSFPPPSTFHSSHVTAPRLFLRRLLLLLLHSTDFRLTSSPWPTGFYRVRLVSCPIAPLCTFSSGVTEFYRVLPGLTGFDWV